ncbi:hypothetical protein JDXMQMMX_CDS50 [Acinetobacter phage vB_AbaM_AB4P2]|nr:hypothetical protein JDXMQMMX_CDS50 [Acinetobacter phage vB_AbaM_AB4P2]
MIAIMLDVKCCGSGASRLLVGKSSRQSQNKWSVSLPCRVRIAALPQRQEHCAAPFTKSARSTGSMLFPVMFPDLLITPQGRSAPNLFTRNRKTLLTYRLLRRHQNNIIVCIYLCGQFLKSPQSRSRKLSEIQSTPQNNHCQHL